MEQSNDSCPLLAVFIVNDKNGDSKEFKLTECFRFHLLDTYVLDIVEFRELKFKESEKVVVELPRNRSLRSGRIMRVDHLPSFVEAAQRTFRKDVEGIINSDNGTGDSRHKKEENCPARDYSQDHKEKF